MADVSTGQLDPITRGSEWRLFLDTPGTATDWDLVPVEVYLDHEETKERVKLRHLVGIAPYEGEAVDSPEPGVRFVMPTAWTAARTPGYYLVTVAVNGAAVRYALPFNPRVLCRDNAPLT